MFWLGLILGFFIGVGACSVLLMYFLNEMSRNFPP